MKKIAILAALAMAASCTGDFKEINRQSNGQEAAIQGDYTMIGVGLIPLQKVVYYNALGWDYQVYQNLNADLWSGYTSSCTFFASNSSNQTYVMNAGWNSWHWELTYEHVMAKQWQNYLNAMRYGFEPQLETDEQIAAADWKQGKYAHFVAVNTILRVMGMARLADQYGPIIYSKWGKVTGSNIAYDNMPDLYNRFFTELKEAVEVLDAKASAGGIETKNMARFDMIYKGDLIKWARLANTLRLRLAMRMVKADAATAKTQAEAAIAAPRGLMAKRDDSYILSGNNWSNPFYTLCVGYEGDCLLNANVTSILGGYDDPRLPKFATTTASGKIVGARLGLPNIDASGKELLKGDYNKIVSLVNVASPSTESVVIYNAEALFLQAEAALRGWNVGGKTAKELYEAGVTASFEFWGVPVGSYLSSTSLPTGWTDPLSARNGGRNDIAKGASTVYPKWEDGDSNEVKLEKIITQKWIAGFPEGMNAWAEYRRTGYPKLFPIAENKSDGAISTELGPRRMPFVPSQYQMNPEGVAAAVAMLGGADKASTRLWWDKDAPNF